MTFFPALFQAGKSSSKFGFRSDTSKGGLLVVYWWTNISKNICIFFCIPTQTHKSVETYIYLNANIRTQILHKIRILKMHLQKFQTKGNFLNKFVTLKM